MKKVDAGVIKRIATSPYLFFFLDYDGTLTPIVARPSLARLAAHDRQILKELSEQCHVQVAIISGRMLEDVKRCVDIPEIIYAGNHGLELEGRWVKHVHPDAVSFRPLAKKLVRRLRLAYAFLNEIFIESKRFTISVHYRQVPEQQVEIAKMILLKVVGAYLAKSQVVLVEGKKVWELRPPTEWNKGKTVSWLLRQMTKRIKRKFLPVYIGDDITDEDAFEALKKHGITIKVTDDFKQSTAADYYLRSPNDVFRFIKRFSCTQKDTYKKDDQYDKRSFMV